MKKILLICNLAIFLACNSANEKAAKRDRSDSLTDKSVSINVDSIFLKWNYSTFSSMDKHLTEEKSSPAKLMYKETKSSFLKYLDIQKENKINQKSIRYKFLKIFFSSLREPKTSVYVIESISSGESIDLNNYVLFLKNGTVDSLWAYNYQYPKWVLIKRAITSRRMAFVYRYVGFDLGRNKDDEIITKFDFNKSTVFADYFIPHTLVANKSEFLSLLNNI